VVFLIKRIANRKRNDWNLRPCDPRGREANTGEMILCNNCYRIGSLILKITKTVLATAVAIAVAITVMTVRSANCIFFHRVHMLIWWYAKPVILWLTVWLSNSTGCCKVTASLQ
jgi:hypothetical protein